MLNELLRIAAVFVTEVASLFSYFNSSFSYSSVTRCTHSKRSDDVKVFVEAGAEVLPQVLCHVHAEPQTKKILPSCHITRRCVSSLNNNPPQKREKASKTLHCTAKDSHIKRYMYTPEHKKITKKFK